MEQLDTVAVAPAQMAQVQLLALGVQRWSLREIVFRLPDGSPCNELTEVWLDLVRPQARAFFHCWTNTLGDCSEEPFPIRFCLVDRYGRTVRTLDWSIAIPGDAGVEYRLHAPCSIFEFDACAGVILPTVVQRTCSCRACPS